MKTLFRWLFRTFFALLLCVIIFVIAVTFLQIPVNLTRFKTPIEDLASKALKQPVRIDDSIIISTSLKPVFTLRGLRVENTDKFTEKNFVSLDLARVQLELLPLLQKKVHIAEIHVTELDINLEELENGDVNWIFASTEKTPSEATEKNDQESEPTASDKKAKLTSDMLVVRKLTFDNIIVNYISPEAKLSRFELTKCNGIMLPGEPMKMDASGMLQSFPYNLDLTISSLEEFLLNNRSGLELNIELAETLLNFKGDVNLEKAHQELVMEAAISGENLNSLDNLLLLDLPPMKAYGVEARVRLKKGVAELENLAVKTGSSSLNGTAHIKKGDKVEVALNLQSPMIQLDDFVFDDWSWIGEEKKEEQDVTKEQEKQPEEEKAGAGEEKKLGLLDPEVLAQLDVKLDVQADAVLSGNDELGKGTLEATLLDGRLAVDKLDISIPGGLILMKASVKPGKQQSDASLDVEIENFDIGILVRRSKPEAKMGGLVNLDIDLKSVATSVDQILANGNGYFDFSGELNNIAAGIIDLWAVNLITAVVSSTEEQQSEINCAVGRWSVVDGKLVPDVFFIDTSKIRICGDGEVDFKNNRVDITVSPTPKRPEFFNLATPVEIHGTLDDIKFGVGGVTSVIGTAVKFIASPVTTPIKRLVKTNIPEDGSDACQVILGPENRTEIKIDGCK
ncbi:AsmA family protein [Desulfosediminicola flagellatus]|uniref:AsmA family protein n=1 Tax=Desulfosediminicola flagellatus TaxID=2569541 RepID=UPI0010AB6A4C|nr:AsmA family protein [Desulfosediminicola flagellatus]